MFGELGCQKLMGKMKISCENGFEKYPKGKKLEPKQNFVGLEAIFNVFWSSESMKIVSLRQATPHESRFYLRLNVSIMGQLVWLQFYIKRKRPAAATMYDVTASTNHCRVA